MNPKIKMLYIYPIVMASHTLSLSKSPQYSTAPVMNHASWKILYVIKLTQEILPSFSPYLSLNNVISEESRNKEQIAILPIASTRSQDSSVKTIPLISIWAHPSLAVNTKSQTIKGILRRKRMRKVQKKYPLALSII